MLQTLADFLEPVPKENVNQNICLAFFPHFLKIAEIREIPMRRDNQRDNINENISKNLNKNVFYIRGKMD